MKRRIGAVSSAVRAPSCAELWSRSSGPIPCLRWATGVPSSSRRPTAGSCWAKKENTPRPSTGSGCATPTRNGLSSRRAVLTWSARLREVPTAGSASGLVRPARGAPGEGGACGRQQILQPIRHHDRADGGDPGGDPPRILGRPPGQGLGQLLQGLETRGQELHADACASNLPSYTDPVTGYDVFTADFLRRRGYCCGNGCRHCPYPAAAKPASSPHSQLAQTQHPML